MTDQPEDPSPGADLPDSVESELSGLRAGRLRESKLTAGEIAELATHLLAQVQLVEPENNGTTDED